MFCDLKNQPVKGIINRDLPARVFPPATCISTFVSSSLWFIVFLVSGSVISQRDYSSINLTILKQSNLAFLTGCLRPQFERDKRSSVPHP